MYIFAFMAIEFSFYM